MQAAKKYNAKRITGVISFMNVGGAQSALLRLARGLRARGHFVEVWCLYEKFSSEVCDNQTITFIAKPRLSFFEYLKVYVQLVRRLRQARPDVVIGFLPLGNVFGLSTAALAGVPRRIACQRSPGTTYGSIMRMLDRILGTTGIYNSIICVSEAVRDSFSDYPHRYRNKLSVIYNGIDQTPLPELDKNSARQRLGLPSGVPLFVAAGRLENQKNHSFLINVVSKIKGVHVAIAGEGGQRRSLETLARSTGVSDRITFLGRLNQESVQQLLKAADIFIQPSLYEGQSNTLLEAMYAGLPIIASDVPAHRETLCDESGNTAGMLVPVESIDDWVSAMTDLIGDPQNAEKMGRCAIDMVQKRFSLNRMIDEFEKVLAG